KGYGHDAVLRTIPIKKTETQHWILYDLDVGEYLVDGVRQPLAMVTGQLGLVAVNTVSGQILSQLPVLEQQHIRLTVGRAIALGRLGGVDVAVVAGSGVADAQSANVLFVVDLSDPTAPQVMGAVALSGGDVSLPGAPTDVLLHDGVAIVAGPRNAVIVSLADPRAPALAGTVPGLAGRIAEGGDGILFSTVLPPTDGNNPVNGLFASRIGDCDLLDLLTRRVEVDITCDPSNGALCGRPAEVVFKVCRPAQVTLTVGTQPATAALHRLATEPPPDPPPSQPVVDVPLQPGVYTAVLSVGTLPTGETEPRVMTVQALEVESGERQAEDGTIRNRVVNRAVLPVGRTFVKGVDLFDGHVVRQAQDVNLRGRHLGLEITRSYSSAGRSGQGVLGAGWSWNFDSRVVEGACGLWTVITADGSSQTFRTTDGGETFAPQRGYHTKLEHRSDRLVFTDKSGAEHFFSEQNDSGRWRLDHVQEPHGDRLVPRYDLSGRVVEVWEVGAEDLTRPLRSLKMGYHVVAGVPRIVSILSEPLKVRVVYTYDGDGNLTSVRHEDVENREQVTESYEYYPVSQNPLDPHQLRAAVDANRARTEYEYYLPTDTFPGEGGSVVVRDKDEYAKEVREFPSQQTPVTTRFAYDVSQSPQARWKTTVTDARDNPILYVLNGNGSPLRIEELPGDPEGRVTQMTWATDDIFKTQEIDAGGRVTDYEYDPRGNLKTETIHSADFGDVITRYEYHPRFNKLTRKVDAELGVTLYEVDPDSGDVTRLTDAEGNITRFHYDPLGRLDRVTSPRGQVTEHSAFDAYGQPQQTVLPEDTRQYRTYDERGRPTREWDSLGRETRYVYDGFDRLREKRRISGREGSEDERTTFEYYDGGQQRAVTNAKGLKTAFVLDGMNRVTTTTLSGGGLPESVTIVPEYDGNGNKEFETDGRGVRRRFHYDGLNRLRRIEVLSGLPPLGEVATFDYDALGNKTRETGVSGAATDYEYDGLYRVKRKLLPETGPSGRYREEYTYDKVGNRRSFTDANDKTTRYGYDKLSRLVRT
ncbi:MAG TPA: DUF6531 domain-containing protein, partial [Vicinamibacteria bacterium]|nr:DUF6531 domain-containing protein [Vicinamibacteria bacterium]